MEKTLELISLDDDELLDVVGGCKQHCNPCEEKPCSSPCGGGFGLVVFAGFAVY
jgi:hypothetical protein